jgi:hypothetical protein
MRLEEEAAAHWYGRNRIEKREELDSPPESRTAMMDELTDDERKRYRDHARRLAERLLEQEPDLLDGE